MQIIYFHFDNWILWDVYKEHANMGCEVKVIYSSLIVKQCYSCLKMQLAQYPLIYTVTHRDTVLNAGTNIKTWSCYFLIHHHAFLSVPHARMQDD